MEQLLLMFVTLDLDLLVMPTEHVGEMDLVCLVPIVDQMQLVKVD